MPNGVSREEAGTMRKSWNPAGLPAVGAVVLGAALFVSCGTGSPVPEGAELIPADATFAVSVDVPAVTNSELYKRYKSEERYFGSNRVNFYKFAEATGLDPAKDITRLLLMARTGDEGIEEMSGIVVGTFDGRKVHDFLAESGLPSRNVAGIDIFEFLVLNDRCRFCLAVIDSSMAAFGDGETLTKIAQVRAGQTPALAGEERAGRLLRRIGRGTEAWGIVRADDLRTAIAGFMSRMNADSSALSKLGPIHEGAFSIDLAEPLRIVVELTTSSEQDAMLVADVIKGGEALGRLALKEARPELAQLLADMLIEADTGVVRVAASVPDSDVEMVMKLVGGEWLNGVLRPSGKPAQPPSL